VIDVAQNAKPSRSQFATPAIVGLLERYALLAFLIVMVGFASLVSPVFLRPGNLLNVLTIAAPLGMVVLGQTFAILVRGLDLSVASLMATVAVLATAFRATSDDMIPVIFVAAIAFSAIVGFANGWLVTKRGVSPFLATLATMIILQGARFAYTGGAPISTLPPGMSTLATGRAFGLPINLWTLAAMAVVLSLLLHKSRFGREIYMVGANPKAARLVGLSPDRVVIACYVICSICAGIGGLFLLGYVGTVSNWVGQGYELDSIVAAVMGGVALSGGRGGVGGALLGVAVLIVVSNLVILLGLPVDAQLIIKGVIIIGAAAFYRAKLI
jgi:ribose/xylose/arabinose/galactoside ABC-type transport system permease subunit